MKITYAFGFIAFVTISQHYINKIWPEREVQHSVVISTPVPTPIPTSTPVLSLHDRFMPFAVKLCGTMYNDAGFAPPPDMVQRIEIQDDKNRAYVYCMRPSDHNITGTYEIGL